MPEAEYLNYKSKIDKERLQKVNLLMANNQLFSHGGLIETIESDFNSRTGNIAFRAVFPNPEGLLRHGETGNIQIPTLLEKALIIPQKATFEILDKKYVYVVDQDNIVSAKLIEVEKELPHIYIVGKGVSKYDKILIDGLRKVKEGYKISFHFVESTDIMSHLDLYAE